jgi:hypothetical protein
MTRRTCLLFASLVIAFSTNARADDRALCLDAAAKGQTMRDQHDLIGARDRFRACSAGGCPAVVQRDCATWLNEVDATLPSVIVSAKSGAGADLVDVHVSVDGQPLLSHLDGSAVPMNPGAHTFHFEAAAGTLDRQVLVREGDKRVEVSVVIGAPVKTPASSSLSSATSPAPAPPSTSASPSASSSWRTVGWVLGGVGVAGLVVGTVFGTAAVVDKNNAHCADSVCDPGTVNGIKRDALVSDVGWIAGGLLAAGGLALVLFPPHAHGAETGGLRIAPSVSASGTGIVMGGSF